MCVADIKYDEVISNESLSYFFKMQDVRDEGERAGLEQGRVEGRAEGIAKGLAKGRTEGLCETARNMRANDCDVTFIAKMTGLTIEEIEKL